MSNKDDERFAKKCAEYIDKWSRMLRLSDWDFELQVVDENDMIENAIASISCNAPRGEAIIKILHADAARRRAFDHNDTNFEADILHELLHLRFGNGILYHDWGEFEKIEIELAINRITEAMLELDERRMS